MTISTEDQYASIDFKDPDALRVLTEVLLKEDWGYEVEIVKGRLVPTVRSISSGPHLISSHLVSPISSHLVSSIPSFLSSRLVPSHLRTNLLIDINPGPSSSYYFRLFLMA